MPGPGTRRIFSGDGTACCAFEEGSGVEVSPLGQASFHRGATVRQGWNGVGPRDAGRGCAVTAPSTERQGAGTAAAGHGGDAPKAPLPSAFRMLRVSRERAPGAEFLVPTVGKGGIYAAPETVPAVLPRARAAGLPRGAFERSIPTHPGDIVRLIKSSIWDYEDAICLGRLCRLGQAGKAYVFEWSDTLHGLAEFVARLNDSRPGKLRLDTVLVNSYTCASLFYGVDGVHSWIGGYPYYDGKARYQNMYVLGGIAFLHHAGIPQDVAYALSSAQAPVFVHGPSSIRGTRDAIEVARHCGLVEPPRNPPECPWGVRFGVERDRDRDSAWPDDGG